MIRWAVKGLVLAVALTCGSFGLTPLGRAEAQATDKSSAKQRDIRRLLKLTGAGELGVQVIRQLMPSLRQMAPGAPDAFWNQFSEKLKPEELTELTVGIYDKYLTAEDVKELIAFYESRVGKKLVQLQPKIMQDSMQAGQQWGAKLAQEAMREIREKGYQKGDTE